ncbi:MAG: hypothetical protein KF744_16690 [Taibaiella sp.]|nr:hypothetical protein [Taibaiella sp.]
MKIRLLILAIATLLFTDVKAGSPRPVQQIAFEFYGDSISLTGLHASFVDFDEPLTEINIRAFYEQMENGGYDQVVTALRNYRSDRKPDDWLYYQLIRKTAQYLSPKGDNYPRYTLYKWYFLSKTGFDATLKVAGDKLLFYVQCDEQIYDIPYYTNKGKQYVCLNYHDYGSIDFNANKFEPVKIDVPEATGSFSYKLTHLPSFSSQDYVEKDLAFNYQDIDYRFKLKLNPKVKNIFANYPVADYQLYFNMPLSQTTYESLIPQLRENVRQMGTKQGVDYLMRFTRYAFLYQPDRQNFGKEKRLMAEQTLLYEGSDCEDRAALFFYLVKEIYNLPMLVLAYPEHVTIAVKFDKPIGKPIIYNGERYTICEPTPQGKDVPLGRISPELQNESYEVAVVYNPR